MKRLIPSFARFALPTRSTVMGWVGISLLAGLLVGLAALIRPYPFTTTDDNFTYFGPLIKAHTDSLITHGRLLKMVWDLGAGWSPWESGQIGLLYPPYHLANLLARMLGRPMAILEASTWLHLTLTGIFAWHLLPIRLEPRERLLAAGAAMTLPAPFILGANWHNYMACHPWFLAMVLLTWREAEDQTLSWRPTLPMVGASLGFFVAAHPSMYVFGTTLLGLWSICYGRWQRGKEGLIRLALAQIPLFLPLIYLRVTAEIANPEWMAGRNDPLFILRHAQGLGTWLHGTLLGNLVPGGGFRAWANASETGVGMFFAPTLILILIFSIRRRDFRPTLFFLALGAVLAIASFPWLRIISIGPFAGFRWTWKLSLFMGTLALCSLLREGAFHAFRPRVRFGILGSAALLGGIVCLRGLAFDLYPTLQTVHSLGAEAIASECRRCFAQLNIPPRSRLALVGTFDMEQPLPLPVLGMVGNAPLWYDQATLSVFEPMESAEAARAHFGLTLPWRSAIAPEAFSARLETSVALLRAKGVQALLSTTPEVLRPVGEVQTFTDILGRRTYVARIPGAETLRTPWATLGGKRVPLVQTIDGRLRTTESSPLPPEVDLPRAIHWQPLEDGRWEGRPEGPGWTWGIVTLLGLLATVPLIHRPRLGP